MRITRRLEFDAGHRIPHHDNRCRHLHGHRYAIELTISGDMVATEGSSEQAMVADFLDIKALLQKHVVDQWDHAFLVYVGDAQVLAFLNSLPGHRTVTFTAPPTAEHLAATAFRILRQACATLYGARVKVERVRIYETPNCWADAGPEDGAAARA